MGNHHGRYSAGRHRRNNHPLPTPPPPPPFHGHKYPAVPYGFSPQIPTSTALDVHMGLSLPYSHIDSSLRALAGQAEGFGRLAIGGLHGPLYHVTTLAGNPKYSFF